MIKKISTLILILSFCLPQLIFAELDTSQNVDTTVLEIDMARRIESLMERLIGSGRAIVKVRLTIVENTASITDTVAKDSADQENNLASEETTEIKGLSGMAIIKNPTRQFNRAQQTSDIVSRNSKIKKMSIKILIDDKMDKKKIELVKESVPAWIGLDTKRGDTFEVQPVPWRDSQLMPIEQLSIKQIEIGKRNIFVGMGIFLILLILAGVIVALIIGLIKLPKAKVESVGGQVGTSDEGTNRIIDSIEKLAKELSSVQLQGKGADKNTGGKIDNLLEDIKEILAHTQSTAETSGAGTSAGSNIGGTNVDSQLGEIGNLLKKQMMGEKPTDKPFGLINSDLSGPEIISITEGEDEEILSISSPMSALKNLRKSFPRFPRKKN
ncbi:MAG: flagellar M-ring protein FliF C-terminal domain-containing protein [Candidatus Omnitrophota bacterium]